MADLHKALTDLCDKWADPVPGRGADKYEMGRHVGKNAVIAAVRALLAEHPPTAPVDQDCAKLHQELAYARSDAKRWKRDYREAVNPWKRIVRRERDRRVRTEAERDALRERLDQVPTAPVVDRGALAKVIEDAWQRGDSDVDAIIAYLDLTEAVVEPCPECAAGKHGNCDGTAWDQTADGPTCCPCAQAEHGGEGS